MKRVALSFVCLSLILVGIKFSGSNEGGGESAPYKLSASRVPANRTPALGNLPVPAAEEKLIPSDVNLLENVFELHGEQLSELRRELVEKLRTDPSFVLACTEQLKTQGNAEFIRFLADSVNESGVLAGSQLLRAASVHLIENSPSADCRRTALHLLSETGPVDAALLATVGGIAQSDADISVKLTALETLRSWLQQDGALQSQVALQLVQTISSSHHQSMEGHALSALASHDAQLSLELISALPQEWRRDASPQNRALMASVLGKASPEAKQLALASLQDALTQETDSDLRALIVSQMIHLGDAGLLERMQSGTESDQQFALQVAGYLQGMENDAARRPN